LKQVDFDKKMEYTNIIQITFESSKHQAIRVYPNPATDYLKIESDYLIGEMIQIFSVNGGLVQELQHESGVTTLSMLDFPVGTYFIKIGNEVKKIIITR
jgi:hypothetical protein